MEMKVVDQRFDVLRLQPGMADEQADHLRPIRFVFKTPSESGLGNGNGELPITPQATHVRPSKGLLDVEMIGRMSEQHCHRLRQPDRNVGSTNAVAKPNMPKPRPMQASLR